MSNSETYVGLDFQKVEERAEQLLGVSFSAKVGEYVWLRCECGRKLFRFRGLPHRGCVAIEIKCGSCGKIAEYQVRYPHLA